MESSITKTLDTLARVKYATLNNLYSRKASDFRGSLAQQRINLNRLIELKLVKKLEGFTFIRQSAREIFYTPTAKGFKAVGIENVFASNKSLRQHIVMHESGKVDLALSFLNCYPNHLIDIDYLSNNKPMKAGKKNYKPDILVKVKEQDLSKEYHFIVEFERSREPQKIIKEKLDLIEKIDFKSEGLSHNTKALIVFANDRYDVFKRPTEYEEGHDQILISQFNKLIELASGHSQRFLFLPFTSFHEIDKRIWIKTNKERVGLM